MPIITNYKDSFYTQMIFSGKDGPVDIHRIIIKRNDPQGITIALNDSGAKDNAGVFIMSRTYAAKLQAALGKALNPPAETLEDDFKVGDSVEVLDPQNSKTGWQKPWIHGFVGTIKKIEPATKGTLYHVEDMEENVFPVTRPYLVAEDENEDRYTNFYRHEECNAEWEDNWSCMCNDKCPECNAEIEPYQSRENASGEITVHHDGKD